MTTKQMLFSVLVLGSVANNMLSMESNSKEPRIFKLDSKTALTNPPVPGDTIFCKNTPKGRYYFRAFQTPEESRQFIENHDGTPCVYCPLLKSVIVSTDNPYDCDALNVAILSDEVRSLRQQLTSLKEKIRDLNQSVNQN